MSKQMKRLPMELHKFDIHSRMYCIRNPRTGGVGSLMTYPQAVAAAKHTSFKEGGQPFDVMCQYAEVRCDATPTPQVQSSCTGKVRFPTEKAASNGNGRRLDVYKCANCGGWHRNGSGDGIKKPLPVLTTDDEAADFVANSDLTQFELSSLTAFKWVVQNSEFPTQESEAA